MSKRVRLRNCTSSHKLDNIIPNKISYASIFDIESADLLNAKNAIFVITSNEIYQPISIDLLQIYNKYAISASANSQDFIYTLSDRKINVPFDNKYGGKIFLNSIGFADDCLILVIDSSKHYKNPALFLRNKKTVPYIQHVTIFIFVKEGLNSYSFKLQNTSILKDLEIVMPKETHFKFPLSYIDSTKSIDLSSHGPLTLDDIRIAKFNISPLSLNLEGYCNEGSVPTNNIHFTIKLKDDTELSGFKNSSFRGGNSSFNMKVPFESPIMLDSIKSVVVKYGKKVIEIPIA